MNRLFNHPTLRLLLQRQLLSTFYLGFFSGLPVALSGSTLQAWFAVNNINIKTISFLSLIGLPYTYKFLWAPLLDRYILPWSGKRRGWILTMQVALALLIGAMAFFNPTQCAPQLAFFAVLVAICSATQDTAIDAYRTDLLQSQERGLGAAMVTCGYRIAMLVSGGLALILAAKLGWRFTYMFMASLMLLGVGVTLWAPEPVFQAKPPTSLRAAVIEPFFEFWARDGKLAILLFIICYKLSDAFALALNTAFLLHGKNFSLEQVGMAYKIIGLLATVFGSFIGGILMQKLGLYRSLLYFGILQGTSNLMFLWLAVVGKSLSLLVGSVFVESFCSGLAAVAFVAFLMNLCDYRYTATQFALFSGFSAIGRVFVGPLAGVVVEQWGWANFYFLACWLAVPGLLLLWYLRNKIWLNTGKRLSAA